MASTAAQAPWQRWGSTMSPPEIKTVGPPPERHAARVVADMCRWLTTEQPRLHARHLALLKTTSAAKLGNPKAQQRFMRRLRADPVLKGRILSTSLNPGKRGKCTLSWLVWKMVTPEGEDASPTDLYPPWICCCMDVFYIRDKDASHRIRLVTFSHHAMQRLAERCGAKTPDDLLAALRDIALWMLNADPQTEIDSLRIPVAGGTAIVEMTEKHGPLVKTVLPPDQRCCEGSAPTIEDELKSA